MRLPCALPELSLGLAVLRGLAVLIGLAVHQGRPPMSEEGSELMGRKVPAELGGIGGRRAR
jgi:hypothetical protein